MTRLTIPLLILAAVLTTGCRYGEVLAFGGGGKAMSGDTGSSTNNGPSDDTGGPPADDSGASPMGSPPTILNINTSLEEYPDISWVVEMTVTYTDPDNDVDGGSVSVMAMIDGQDPEEISFPIDGSQAIDDPEDGTVFMALMVNNGSVSGTLSVVLSDSAGQMSEPFDQPF